MNDQLVKKLVAALVAGVVAAGPAYLGGSVWEGVLGSFLAGVAAYLKQPVSTNV